MLRKYHANDLPRLLEIENEVQLSPWPPEVFKQTLARDNTCWVIEKDQQVAAFIIISAITGEIHILNLCVSRADQRSGYGQQLLRYVLQQAVQEKCLFAYLEVRRSNQAAIALYEKMDFVQIGERRGYYPAVNGREDALIFAKDLKQE